MTVKQATELEQAIERAAKHNIEVTGRGFRKSDHAVIYTTNSATEANRWHIVTVVGNRLVCDCPSRKICTHRAAVHIELVVAAAKREARAAEITAALEAEANAAAAQDMAQAEHQAKRAVRQARHETAKLATDTRVFSVFAPERRGTVAISREAM